MNIALSPPTPSPKLLNSILPYHITTRHARKLPTACLPRVLEVDIDAFAPARPKDISQILAPWVRISKAACSHALVSLGYIGALICRIGESGFGAYYSHYSLVV